tara:strand:+ start:2672 stop:3253 length:582 start_codon:yes stop_codon:yes gene_type:complete
MRQKIHSTAIIDDNVQIGNDTFIWHWTHVSSGSRIGDNCTLGQNVFIGQNVEIGNNCKIQNNVSVYNSVILEDDVFCGPSMVFTNVINPRSHIDRKSEFMETAVKKGATIGANATILCGISLGEYSFIAAGAVVLKDVKPYALMAGNPAVHKGWVSQSGERLDLPINGNAEIHCNKSKLTYTLENDNIVVQKK